jgi:hypothetical protein
VAYYYDDGVGLITALAPIIRRRLAIMIAGG